MLCRISYSVVSFLYASFIRLITSIGEESYFLLGIGCVILLWHSLAIPYNHFGRLGFVVLLVPGIGCFN